MFTLLSLLSLLSAPVAAQDFATVWFAWQPPAGLTQADADEADDQLGEGLPGELGDRLGEDAPATLPSDVDARFLSTNVSVMIPPIKLVPDRLMLVNGLGFFHTNSLLSGLDDASGVEDTANLFSVTWQIIGLGRINEKWALAAFVIPGLHSNFQDELSGRDFLVQYMGLVAWTPREGLSLGLGGGYTSVFGIPRYFPLVQVGAEGERWRVSALAPTSGEVFYEVVNDATSIGVKAGLQGGQFHRGSDEPDYPEDIYIQYSVGTVGPAVEQRLGEDGALKLIAEGGYTWYRRFDIYQGVEPVYDFDLEKGFALKATLAFTPSPPEPRDP